MDIYILVRYDGILQNNVMVTTSEIEAEMFQDKLLLDRDPEDHSIYNIEHWEC